MNTQKLSIKNLEDRPRIIIIEPQGEEIVLESGKVISLQMSSNKKEDLELFLEKDCIIIYA